MERVESVSDVGLSEACKDGRLRMSGSGGEKEVITMLVEQIKELIENGGMFWAASSFLYSYVAKGEGGPELRRNATIGMGAIALFKAWRVVNSHLFTTIVIPQDLGDRSDLYRYARELLQHNANGDSGLTLAENGGSGMPMRMVQSTGFQSTAFDLKPWRKTDSQMFVWRGPICQQSALLEEVRAVAPAIAHNRSTMCSFAAMVRRKVAVGLSLDIGNVLPQNWASVDQTDEIRVTSTKFMDSIKRGAYLRVGQEIMQVWRISPATQSLCVFRAQQHSTGIRHDKNQAVFSLAKSSWLESIAKRLFGPIGPGKLLWISEDTGAVPGADKKEGHGRKYHKSQPYYGDPLAPYPGMPGQASKHQPAAEQGLVLTVLGRDLAWLQEMLAEGKKVYDKNAEGHLVVLYRPESMKKHHMGDPYAWDYGGAQSPDCWIDKRVPGRPLASVVLPRVSGRGREEELRDDVARFFSKEEEKFYRARGMPHRRGYLLHGVPGSGKTSVIKAIACDMNLPIFSMSLNMEGMNDSVFMKLMDKVPPRSIILFEDIDAAKTSADRNTLAEAAEQAKSEKKKPSLMSEEDLVGHGGRSRRGTRTSEAEAGVKLDTLLNTLDGLNAQENRVVFMTTNHKERLDAALIRPGRIDKQVEFCHVSSEQAERYFRRFYSHLGAGEGWAEKAGVPAQLEEAAAAFGHHVEGLSHLGVPVGLSVCELQQFLMEHRESFAEAAASSAVELRQTLLAKYFKLKFKPAKQKLHDIVRSVEHNAAVFAGSVAPQSVQDMRLAVRFLDQHKTQADALASLSSLLEATPTLRPQLAVSG